MKKHSFKRVKFKNFLTPLPKDIKDSINKLRTVLEVKFGARCMIVGGAVRDRLLDREVKDIDIEIYNISIEDFEKAMSYLNANGVGRSFFVYKYNELDITLPRVEKKVSAGHRGFEVRQAYNEREASRRRDFTINALLFDIDREEILDYWGGLEDLKSKVLRVVDSKTFIEDSLRVLRAMQFASRLGFKIEKDSCNLCKDMDLGDLSKERIFTEFKKMFLSEYLEFGLYYLFSLKIADKILGLNINRLTFFKITKSLNRASLYFEDELREYYFLAILYQYLDFDMRDILNRLGAPVKYHKMLDSLAKIPKKVTSTFVADLAKKNGLKDSVLNYNPDIRNIAKSIGVWDKPFDIGVSPKELIDRGFRGKAIGDELERLRIEKISKLGENV